MNLFQEETWELLWVMHLLGPLLSLVHRHNRCLGAAWSLHCQNGSLAKFYVKKIFDADVRLPLVLGADWMDNAFIVLWNLTKWQRYFGYALSTLKYLRPILGPLLWLLIQIIFSLRPTILQHVALVRHYALSHLLHEWRGSLAEQCQGSFVLAAFHWISTLARWWCSVTFFLIKCCSSKIGGLCIILVIASADIGIYLADHGILRLLNDWSPSNNNGPFLYDAASSSRRLKAERIRLVWQLVHSVKLSELVIINR